MKIKALYGIANSTALNLNASSLSEINEEHLCIDLKKPTITPYFFINIQMTIYFS
jgi:hypothetical protein